MTLRVRRLPWLLSFALVACRLGYGELAVETSGDATLAGRDGAGGKAASGGTSTVSGGKAMDAPGGAGLGADADQVGGDGSQTAGGATETGGSATQGGGGAAQAGSGGSAGGSSGCANALALTANAAPSTAPPLSCFYPGALICDDFEDGQEPYWTVIANAPAQASLETCVVHGDSHSLWVRPSGTNNVQLQRQLSPTIGSGSLFVRTFAYLPSNTLLPAWTVLDEVWDSPTSWTNKISLDLQADGTITLNNWTGPGQRTSALTSTSAVLPRDRWTCLELEILVSKNAGATLLYIDDVQVITSIGAVSTRGNRAFTTVSLGAAIPDGSPELYYDDLVVSTQRIGCN